MSENKGSILDWFKVRRESVIMKGVVLSLISAVRRPSSYCNHESPMLTRRPSADTATFAYSVSTHW